MKRRLRCHWRRRLSASVNEQSSSPLETMALMRFSSSALCVTATLPCSTKALRWKTSRLTPVSISPALFPFKPSMGTLVPVYTAENSRIGADAVFVVRVMVISLPPLSSCMLPCIAEPDHGAKRILSGKKPAFWRSELSTP